MRVLVVGASGPLGRAVVPVLRAAGHQVVGVSRSGGASSIPLDVTDHEQSSTLLLRVRPEAVVYLARPELDGPAVAAIENETHSLQRFAFACADAGATRFVFASSAAVYGTASPLPHTEDDPLDDGGAYAALKIHSERALGSAPAPLSVTVLRIFNVYGPGFGSSLVNRLAAADGRVPVVYDSERYVRDYVHSSDVARAFAMAIGSAEPTTAVLNVGSGTGLDNPSLLALFPDAHFRRHDDPDIVSHSISDITRIRALWGFEPRVSVSEAAMYPDLFL